MSSEISTVTSKGQLVIPSRLRRKYGIRKGTLVSIREKGNSLILQPLTQEFVRKIRGSVKGNRSALQVLSEDRERDREL